MSSVPRGNTFIDLLDQENLALKSAAELGKIKAKRDQLWFGKLIVANRYTVDNVKTNENFWHLSNLVSAPQWGIWNNDLCYPWTFLVFQKYFSSPGIINPF